MILVETLASVLALTWLAVSATACEGVGGPELTTLTTSLSGEGKEGVTLTVLEGSKVKDKATLKGKNASSATGKVTYKVYSDSECKTLVTSAGEVTVGGESVPASSEEELEGGNTYYWQAHYTGDAKNAESTSECTEIATVKAKTSLSTTLSGESKEGKELTVLEGSKIKDTATLTGTKSSTATGKATYAVYSDSECKTLVTSAGEVTVTSGSVPASSEKELEGGNTYYWQAHYTGDTKHAESTSPCNEIATVKALTSIKTLLVGEDNADEAPIQGDEITVGLGEKIADTATLTGKNASNASGTVTYSIYADSECKELVSEAGKVSVSGGEAPISTEETPSLGTYYWQATYSGDALDASSSSSCGSEIATIKAQTSVATSLSGEAQSGTEITVTEGASASDTATLTGEYAAFATGQVTYKIYLDPGCTELVAEAGEATVAGESVPSSSGVTLEPGVYYWQADYSGDSSNLAGASLCGSEREVVVPQMTTALTGSAASGHEIEVDEGTPVTDVATLHGENASAATGTVTYDVYSDSSCKTLYSKAGEVSVEGAVAPASSEVTPPPGYYYWRAEYSGDEHHPPVTTECGSEVLVVTAPTSLTTGLSGGGKSGAKIEVGENTPVSDTATLSGSEASTADGQVAYNVYADAECKDLLMPAGEVNVSSGTVPASAKLALPPGTYYWQAEYLAGGVNGASTSSCGSEIETVAGPLTTSLTSATASGNELVVSEGTAVHDDGTLHDENAETATGTLKYKIYSDEKCTELYTEAGEVSVEGAVAPASSEETLPAGYYYWQAEYSGDEHNPPATSACGATKLLVMGSEDKYAAIGDSFSSGVGVTVTPPGGWDRAGPTPTFYEMSDIWSFWGPGTNRCYRSSYSWPARVAEAYFGAGVITEAEVFKQQPPNFIFRACSGSVAENLWTARVPPPAAQRGRYNEAVLGPPLEWLTTPAENLWLSKPGGSVTVPMEPNPDIKLVTLTIGINDAGFRTVVEHCLAPNAELPVPVRNWLITRCETVVREWETGVRGTEATLPVPPNEREGIPSVEGKLETILEDAHERAPNALLRIPLYPKILELRSIPEIPVEEPPALLAILNPPGGIGSPAVDIEKYREALNGAIIKAVAAWMARVGAAGKASVVPDTINAFVPTHLLGRIAPWVNGFIRPEVLHPRRVVESFHPNCLGQNAVAGKVLEGLGWAAAAVPAWTCP